MKSIRRAKSLQLHEHSRDFEGLVVSDRDFQPLLKQKQCLSLGWLGWLRGSDSSVILIARDSQLALVGGSLAWSLKRLPVPRPSLIHVSAGGLTRLLQLFRSKETTFSVLMTQIGQFPIVQSKRHHRFGVFDTNKAKFRISPGHLTQQSSSVTYAAFSRKSWLLCL